MCDAVVMRKIQISLKNEHFSNYLLSQMDMVMKKILENCGERTNFWLTAAMSN